MTVFIAHDTISFYNITEFIDTLSRAKKWKITVEPYKERRSLSQNALYWVWVEKVAKECGDSVGYTKNEMARIFKQMFLVPSVVTHGGVDYPEYSTKGLSKAEMSEYMSHIDHFAVSEFGVYVPIPEELQRNF